MEPAAALTNGLVAKSNGASVLAALLADHRQWWHSFWAHTAHIEMPGSPAAEKLWYGSLYILASGNRTTASQLLSVG